MTLLGKVFSGLIFILSILFFAFALTINATHNNWRDAVLDPNTGYQARISTLTKNVDELKRSKADADLKLAEEQAARRATLAALQTQLDGVKSQLAELTKEKLELQASNTELSQSLNANTAEQERLEKENEEVKQRIVTVLEDRNSQRAKAIELTDALNNFKVLLDSLEKRRDELLDTQTLTQAQLDSARAALAANGIDEDPDDVAPTNLRGIVTAVGRDGAVELSLGADDGLRVGHKLEVYRGSKYLGRLTVEIVDFDKSIARSDKNFRRGYIQAEDRVVPTL